MKEQPEHSLLLRWLILTGLIFFSLIVAFNEDVISLLFTVDKSRICWAIALIYLLVTLHCAKRIYTISLQTNLSRKVDDIIKNENKLALKIDDEQVLINSRIKLPDCFMTEYIRDLYYRNNNIANSEDSGSLSDLIDVYESRLKGPQEMVKQHLLKKGSLNALKIMMEHADLSRSLRLVDKTMLVLLMVIITLMLDPNGGSLWILLFGTNV